MLLNRVIKGRSLSSNWQTFLLLCYTLWLCFILKNVAVNLCQ